jgi:hypothetical protein
MSDLTNSPEPKSAQGKWSESCSGQAVIVGCGTPIFLFLLALIFSADEFALLIPIILFFFTLPLIVIGVISDGKARSSVSNQSGNNNSDQIPPTTISTDDINTFWPKSKRDSRE